MFSRCSSPIARDRDPGARAAYELGVVAVYRTKDRNSQHRLKADPECLPDQRHRSPGTYIPVGRRDRRDGPSGQCRRYLPWLRVSIGGNPDLAAACAAAGISFVGPSAEVPELAGNESRAIAAAREAGLPVLMSSAVDSVDELCCRLRPACRFHCSSKAVAIGGAGYASCRRYRGASEASESREARVVQGTRRSISSRH